MGKGPLIKEPRPAVDNDTDMGGEYYCVPLFPTSFLNTLVVSVGLKGVGGGNEYAKLTSPSWSSP